jgi:hypothetical protein
MEPMTYGEMIASRLVENRAAAARERLARVASDTRVASWRVASGRFLVTAGERIAGCAELARGEPKPVVKVLG